MMPSKNVFAQPTFQSIWDANVSDALNHSYGVTPKEHANLDVNKLMSGIRTKMLVNVQDLLHMSSMVNVSHATYPSNGNPILAN